MNVVSGDANIFYDVTGQGPDLVLLHPFPTNHRFWALLAPLLAPRHRLILPDLRGHGDSNPGEGPATMAKHAADLLRVCDNAGVKQAVFAGVSIGGYVLFEFWRQHRDRVAALVLSDTRAQADTPEGRATRLKSAEEVRKHGPAAFIESMTPKLLGASTRSGRPDLVASAVRRMKEMSVAGIVALQQGMAERPDSVPTLKTIAVPTLVLVGEEDVLTPPADAELLHQNISGSRLHRIPRAGHFAAFEQPEETARLLRGFLDPLPP